MIKPVKVIATRTSKRVKPRLLGEKALLRFQPGDGNLALTKKPPPTEFEGMPDQAPGGSFHLVTPGIMGPGRREPSLPAPLPAGDNLLQFSPGQDKGFGLGGHLPLESRQLRKGRQQVAEEDT